MSVTLRSFHSVSMEDLYHSMTPAHHEVLAVEDMAADARASSGYQTAFAP